MKNRDDKLKRDANGVVGADIMGTNAMPTYRQTCATGVLPFHVPRKTTVVWPSDKVWGTPKMHEEILRGHVPAAPFLRRTDKVMAIGSCFANNLSKYLKAAGVPVTTHNVPSTLQNVFSIQQFFEWIDTGWENGAYWNEPDGGQFVPSDTHAAYRADLADARLFIVTLGLSEVWKDSATDQVLWRGVPRHIYDHGRHKFELATVDATVASIRRIEETIRRISPKADVVFTLSPVPLSATFTGKSAVTANVVSKAILRVALDLAVRDAPGPWVHYWPSYEMVNEVSIHTPVCLYNDYSHRHVDDSYVKIVVDAFMRHYFLPAGHNSTDFPPDPNI